MNTAEYIYRTKVEGLIRMGSIEAIHMFLEGGIPFTKGDLPK